MDHEMSNDLYSPTRQVQKESIRAKHDGGTGNEPLNSQLSTRKDVKEKPKKPFERSERVSRDTTPTSKKPTSKNANPGFFSPREKDL